MNERIKRKTPNDQVLAEQDENGIVVLTLNKPERRNAYSMEVKQGLIALLPELMDDPNCRAIVLTGAGGNFSAGGDVSQMRDRSIIEMRRFMEVSHDIVLQITRGPKPVIAAVEGLAFGAGLSFACASDYVVAASNARFCAVFMRLGILPDVGLRWTLTRRVGPSKAQELITLTDEVVGAEAERIGIANKICEPGSALEVAIKMAKRFIEIPPIAFALNKAAYFDGAASLSAAVQSELAYQPILKLTNDHREAVSAFREKRKAVFTGT